MFCHSPIVGLRISPAAVVGDDFADGGDDRVAELGVRGEAIEDGLVDGGPEFVFRGRIVGVGRDQEDLVLGRVVGRLFLDFRGGQIVVHAKRLGHLCRCARVIKVESFDDCDRFVTQEVRFTRQPTEGHPPVTEGL